MSVESKETVADIMSEMREYADSMEKHLLYDLRECATDYLRVLADRIEAAAKREREAGAEAAQIVGEIGEIIGREEARQESLQGCNAAAMREALMEASIVLSDATHHHMTEDDAKECIAVIESALSAPPRNCDRYSTLEEAEAAWDLLTIEERCRYRFFISEWLFDEAKGEPDGIK